MSLILNPDEVKAVKDKWCRTWYEGVGFGLEDVIVKAGAEHMGQQIVLWLSDVAVTHPDKTPAELSIELARMLKIEGIAI